MKNLSFLMLTVALAIGVISCGNKDSNSSGSTNTTFATDGYTVSTVQGYLNVQQPIAVVGNQTYTISQQSYSIMSQAFQLAYQQNIQPTMINGAQMFKANITGSLQTGYSQTGYTTGYNQTGYNQAGNTLNVTQAVIYR